MTLRNGTNHVRLVYCGQAGLIDAECVVDHKTLQSSWDVLGSPSGVEEIQNSKSDRPRCHQGVVM